MPAMPAIAWVGLLLAQPEGLAEVLTPPVLESGLVSLGDPAPVYRVLAKARRGEDITVGVIGGSITAGASATAPDNVWGNRVAAWWRETFPAIEVGFVNAGIGATGSDIGAHRVARDLLAHNPDFVVIEYAVNDPNTRFAAETLEGVVRRVLAHPTHPAAMLLFTMNNAGGNAQEWHSTVGSHYGLPMVSLRDAMWPRIEAGALRWEDIEADEVHPNDLGHAICAELAIEVLRRHHAALPADTEITPPSPLPEPLYSDAYARTAVVTAGDARADAIGFSTGRPALLGDCWSSEEPGARLDVRFEGTSVGVVYYRIKGDMGRARAWVDDGEPVILEGWFEADWGGYSACTFVGVGLEPEEHVLHIQVLPDRAEASAGHHFEIHGVLVAGLP